MKSITELENELFARWKVELEKENRLIVTDGVVDPIKYKQSNPKILYILKEANNIQEEGFDLREYVKKLIEHPRKETWEDLLRWTYGIRSLEKEHEWKYLQNDFFFQNIEHLSSIAFMNIKKSTGGHTSIEKELQIAVENYSNYLIEQFFLYEPQVVIFCGSIVSDLFSNIVLGGKLDWKSTTRGIWYFIYKQRTVCIAFTHPTVRVASNFVYYSLIDAVREIKQNHPEIFS